MVTSWLLCNFMEYDPTKTDAENASAEAIHKAKNAAQAVEVAREAQMAELAQKTAEQTKSSLLEALKEVFSDEDTVVDPAKAKILVHRIPVICRDIVDMKKGIETTQKGVDKINDNLSKVVWIVLTAVILAVLGVIFVK